MRISSLLAEDTGGVLEIDQSIIRRRYWRTTGDLLVWDVSLKGVYKIPQSTGVRNDGGLGKVRPVRGRERT